MKCTKQRAPKNTYKYTMQLRTNNDCHEVTHFRTGEVSVPNLSPHHDYMQDVLSDETKRHITAKQSV
jgi:hypothetical protein